MNKNIVLIVLISLLPFIFIFSTPQFFYTQDGWTHLARGGAYFKALSDGQIPVRWAADLNYSYGMPLFNFVFQIPYIFMSVFIFLGFGLVNSLKIITLLSFLFSGVFMYLFAREFFDNEKKAFLVTVFYQFFPYHLVDMLVRGSIGESFAFTFFPLLLYGISLANKRFSFKSALVIAVGSAGLVLSHLATGAVFFLIAAGVIVLFVRSKKRKIAIFASIGWGLGIAAYYWMPALLDHKYTYGSLFAKDLYAQHFVPFEHFFYPNFFNAVDVRMGDVPIHIGIFHTIAAIAAVVYFLRAKKKSFDNKIIFFCFTILTMSVFIMQPVSNFVWENVPLFEQFQFPWRFLAPVGFATAMLSVYLLFIPHLKKKALYVLLLMLVIGTTAYYWYPQLGFRTVNENDYWNYPKDTTYFGETNLVWSAGPASDYPKEQVEVISGDARITNLKKKSNVHTYTVVAKENTIIVDHTQFFPGWRVFVSGEDTQIQFQDPNYRGEITFSIPKGEHAITTKFSETKLHLFADIISIVAILLIGGLWFAARRRVLFQS